MFRKIGDRCKFLLLKLGRYAPIYQGEGIWLGWILLVICRSKELNCRIIESQTGTKDLPLEFDEEGVQWLEK